MLNWEKFELTSPAEFPLDLLQPPLQCPPVYYWNNDTKTREVCNDKGGWVTVPQYEMTAEEIAFAKLAMAEGLVTGKRTQAGEAVSGDKTGLVIFIGFSLNEYSL